MIHNSEETLRQLEQHTISAEQDDASRLQEAEVRYQSHRQVYRDQLSQIQVKLRIQIEALEFERKGHEQTKIFSRMQLRNFLVPKFDFPREASALGISTEVVGTDIIGRENNLEGRPFRAPSVCSSESEL